MESECTAVFDIEEFELETVNEYHYGTWRPVRDGRGRGLMENLWRNLRGVYSK
jgi:hypothetical protein